LDARRTAARRGADRVRWRPFAGKGIGRGTLPGTDAEGSADSFSARVRAVFRRTDIGPGRGDVIRASDVTLDVPRMRARVDNRPIELTLMCGPDLDVGQHCMRW